MATKKTPVKKGTKLGTLKTMKLEPLHTLKHL